MSKQLSCLCLIVLLCGFAAVASAQQKKLLLLGQSPDGHPRATHEYMPGVEVVAQCLADVPEILCQVERADDPWTAGPEFLRDVDGVLLFVSEGAKWMQADARRWDAFTQLAARGGGFITLHWGMGTKDAKYIGPFLQLLGGCHGGPDRKYKVVDDAQLKVVDRDHPVTTSIEDFLIRDEFYYQLKIVDAKASVQPILQTTIDEQVQTVAWAWSRPDGGRSFGFSGLHFHDNWRRDEYRRLVAQAVLWSLDLPVPRGGLKVALPAEEIDLSPTGQ